MDENNFYLNGCDVLGILIFGGVLEDENGNAFQGEIDVLYGINGHFCIFTSPNYLNVSKFK